MKKKSLIGWGKNFIWFKAFRTFPWYFSSVLVAQLSLTLSDLTDYSLPGFSVHRILQARMLEWIAISFSRGSSQPRDRNLISCTAIRFFTIWATGISYYPRKEHNGGKLSKGRLREWRESKWGIQVKALSRGAVSQAPTQIAFCLFPLPVQFSSVQSLSSVWLFATPRTTARQASLSITNTPSLLKLMSIESVMPSSHLILCRPLLLLHPIPPRIRVFSNESTLRMRWSKYSSFSFSISPSSEHPGLISFRMDWLDLLAAQGTLKSLLQHHSSKA